jgi:TldD protein
MTQPPSWLERLGVDERGLERGLESALGPGIDEAELFLEHGEHEALMLESGRVRSATCDVVQGVGVRALAGERTGYAHSDDVTVQSLRLAGSTAGAIADRSGSPHPVQLPPAAHPSLDLYPVATAPTRFPTPEKVQLLERIERLARAESPRVESVRASLQSENRHVAIVGSDGRNVADARPLVVLRVEVVAANGERRATGRAGCGGRCEIQTLLDGEDWRQATREAVRIAVTNLDAVPCPAGEMDVVLGPGWPGILLHEAIGHGLEADFNRRRQSAFSDRIGERVATELCTVIDDGTLAGRRGSLNVDDEGAPTQRTVLIENGILTGYLQDRLNARLMGMAPTGNGRRQSYAHPPMPRMTNTFMLAGDEDPADIIRGVQRGLYAVSFGGGQVDITSGRFVFSASEAYLIEDGRIASPVRDATLIGNGPDVLTRVTAVGNDLALDLGIGTCGKDGQLVPVGVGLPTLRVRDLTVGGTAT